MRHTVRSTAAAAAITLAGLLGSTAPGQAYQVDCAILLCLAGGWPASAPCAHARAVFIRRVTPWPIEPPLQIWHCPMAASYSGTAPLAPVKRLHDIVFRSRALNSVSHAAPLVVPVQSDEQADIDISSNAFEFVRSIRVYHIQFSQWEDREGNCLRSDTTRLGAYGVQGEFRWERASAAQVPAASDLMLPADCSQFSYRSVFVDWRDHAGSYGYEEVHY